MEWNNQTNSWKIYIHICLGISVLSIPLCDEYVLTYIRYGLITIFNSKKAALDNISYFRVFTTARWTDTKSVVIPVWSLYLPLSSFIQVHPSVHMWILWIKFNFNYIIDPKKLFMFHVCYHPPNQTKPLKAFTDRERSTDSIGKRTWTNKCKHNHVCWEWTQVWSSLQTNIYLRLYVGWHFQWDFPFPQGLSYKFKQPLWDFGTSC